MSGPTNEELKTQLAEANAANETQTALITEMEEKLEANEANKGKALPEVTIDGNSYQVLGSVMLSLKKDDPAIKYTQADLLDKKNLAACKALIKMKSGILRKV